MKFTATTSGPASVADAGRKGTPIPLDSFRKSLQWRSNFVTRITSQGRTQRMAKKKAPSAIQKVTDVVKTTAVEVVDMGKTALEKVGLKKPAAAPAKKPAKKKAAKKPAAAPAKPAKKKTAKKAAKKK
jgi:hypothetical protein